MIREVFGAGLFALMGAAGGLLSRMNHTISREGSESDHPPTAPTACTPAAAADALACRQPQDLVQGILDRSTAIAHAQQQDHLWRQDRSKLQSLSTWLSENPGRVAHSEVERQRLQARIDELERRPAVVQPPSDTESSVAIGMLGQSAESSRASFLQAEARRVEVMLNFQRLKAAGASSEADIAAAWRSVVQARDDVRAARGAMREKMQHYQDAQRAFSQRYEWPRDEPGRPDVEITRDVLAPRHFDAPTLTSFSTSLYRETRSMTLSTGETVSAVLKVGDVEVGAIASAHSRAAGPMPVDARLYGRATLLRGSATVTAAPHDGIEGELRDSSSLRVDVGSLTGSVSPHDARLHATGMTVSAAHTDRRAVQDGLIAETTARGTYYYMNADLASSGAENLQPDAGECGGEEMMPDVVMPSGRSSVKVHSVIGSVNERVIVDDEDGRRIVARAKVSTDGTVTGSVSPTTLLSNIRSWLSPEAGAHSDTLDDAQPHQGAPVRASTSEVPDDVLRPSPTHEDRPRAPSVAALDTVSSAEPGADAELDERIDPW